MDAEDRDSNYLYQPDGSISTHGPYYGNAKLFWSDDKRMIGLEKAQKAQTLKFQLIGFAALVLIVCFSL